MSVYKKSRFLGFLEAHQVALCIFSCFFILLLSLLLLCMKASQIILEPQPGGSGRHLATSANASETSVAIHGILGLVEV